MSNISSFIKGVNQGRRVVGDMPSSRRIGGMPLPPAPTWNDMFYELLKFRAYTGHCIVPKSYPLLYSWVLTQRQLKLQQAQKSKNRERRTGIKSLTDPATKGILTKERIKVLDSVGFVWGLPVDNVEWQKKFEELVWYKHQYGHWNVPIFSDLGRWVSRQRAMKRVHDQHEQGKAVVIRGGSITKEQIWLLNSIQFAWEDADEGEDGGKQEALANEMAFEEENEAKALSPQTIAHPAATVAVDKSESPASSSSSSDNLLLHHYWGNKAVSVRSKKEESIIFPTKRPSVNPLAPGGSSSLLSRLVSERLEDSSAKKAAAAVKPQTPVPPQANNNTKKVTKKSPIATIATNERETQKATKTTSEKKKKAAKESSKPTPSSSPDPTTTTTTNPDDNKGESSTESPLWEQHFQELRDFLQKHHAVPLSDETPLGRWVKQQIRMYVDKKEGLEKNNVSSLSNEQLVKLDSLGLNWSKFSSDLGIYQTASNKRKAAPKASSSSSTSTPRKAPPATSKMVVHHTNQQQPFDKEPPRKQQKRDPFPTTTPPTASTDSMSLLFRAIQKSKQSGS